MLESRLVLANPAVVSIVPDPSQTGVNVANPRFVVTFSADVTGVDASDFVAVPGPGVLVAPVALGVTGSGTTYTVTVNGVSGVGTLGLNLVDNNSIRDGGGNGLVGNGNGTFQAAQNFAAGLTLRSVAVGDVNGDGRLDLAVANYISETVSVLLGNGNGTFQGVQNFATGGGPFSVTMGDVNGDGRLDLAVANYISETVSVLLGNGNGTFQGAQNFATGLYPRSVSVGDVNGDGRLDLVVANSSSYTVSVLLGNGNGTCQGAQNFPTGAYPRSVSVGDVNGDGRLDLVVANSGSNTVSVLLGNGNGTFQGAQNFPTGSNPISVSVGDVNGDGRLDLAVANGSSATVSVLLGNGNGTFQGAQNFPTGSNPLSVSVGDVNGDGRLDLAVANRGKNTVSVLVGNGNGTFQAAQNFPTGSNPMSVSVGDVNGDGRVDLAVANSGSNTVSVLLNSVNGNFTGQLHAIDTTAPVVVSVLRQNPLAAVTGADQLVFRITFSEAVQNLSIGDFTLGGTSAAEATLSSVTPVSTSIYDATITRFAYSNGTIRLLFATGQNITDLVTNALTATNPGTSETFSVVNQDLGDAPDTGAGPGVGNYKTLSANGGPVHTIVAGLFLGARVDSEVDPTPNSNANGDDTSGSADDEDGVVNPLSDLVLTVGTQPTVTLRATNLTGSNATLSGWIDYNADGVFDNATEQVQASVASGIDNGLVTLTFPVIRTAFFGTTYARFRLSTDGAAANPNGAANDGEVEDYAVTIVLPASGKVRSDGATLNPVSGDGIPAPVDNDRFGSAVAGLGDLNGDTFNDLAVGAPGRSGGRGAVFVQQMAGNGGFALTTVEIANGALSGQLVLEPNDGFGSTLATIGDLDGDGIVELAVGAPRDDDGGSDRGAVYILFLGPNGTLKRFSKIASGVPGGPALANGDEFGSSIASLGDLDGDGVIDIAVGAAKDDTGTLLSDGDRGAVYILFLTPQGTVRASTKLASGSTGTPLSNKDLFGSALATLGDLDGDHVTELAVGAPGTSSSGGAVTSHGAVHVLYLRSDGTARLDKTKVIVAPAALISDSSLSIGNLFGSSLASLGDLDGDGVTDLAIGTPGDPIGGTASGEVYLLLLNADGSGKSGFTRLTNKPNSQSFTTAGHQFGTSVAVIGDVGPSPDGVLDLLVGAPGAPRATGGVGRGSLHVLRMEAGQLGIFGTVKNGVTQAGIANARVYLDLNNNAIFDAGDESAPLTDASGSYQFQAGANPLLARIPGNLTVRAEFPTGFAPVRTLFGKDGNADLYREYFEFPDGLRSFTNVNFTGRQIGTDKVLTIADRVVVSPDPGAAAGPDLVVPVRLNLLGGLTSAADLTLNFDPKVLEFTSVTPGALLDGWTATANPINLTPDGPSGVRISLRKPGNVSPLSGTAADLARLVFRVKEALRDGRFSKLELTSPNLDGVDSNLFVSNGTVLVINPPSLRVTKTEVLDDALRFTFNQEFSLGSLNAYALADSQDTVDIAVETMPAVGTSTILAGTLIPSADRKTAIFVLRDGPFASGKYKVTLKSGPFGWRGDDTRRLDGNSDGLVGDDYVLDDFTVARTSTSTLSLPDFARGPGQVVDVDPRNVSSDLPVTLLGASGVTSFDVSLEYDPLLLEIDATNRVGQGPAGWALSSSITTAAGRSTLRVIGGGPAFTEANKGLFRINARVPVTATYGAFHRLEWKNVVIGNGSPTPVAVALDSAVHLAAFVGDATGSRGYSGLDASFVIEAVLTGGPRPTGVGFSAYPLVDPLIVADVQNNLSDPNAGNSPGLTTEDAQRVAQKVVGLARADIIPDVPILPGGAPPLSGQFDTGLFGIATVAPAPSPLPVVSFGALPSLTAGQTATVSIVLSRAPTLADKIRFVDVQLEFDAAKVQPSPDGANGIVRTMALTSGTVLNKKWDIEARVVGNKLVFSAYSATPIDDGAAIDLGLYLVNLLAQSVTSVGSASLSMGPITVVDRTRQLPETGLPYQYPNTPASLTVQPANSPPTDIALSPASVLENRPSGTEVGTFSTTDAQGGTFTYTLVTGGGDADNGSFEIAGARLLTKSPFNFEGKNSYSIRVQTTDGGSLSFNKVFTISVTNVAEPPVAVDDPVVRVQNVGAVTIPVLANDSDPDTPPGSLTITSVSTTPTGTVTISGDGKSVVYAPNAGFSGNDTFTYTVSDGTSTRTASVQISVTNVAPTLDDAGNPFAILGVGSRQSDEMRQGVTVAEILARGANRNPISDPDVGALRGIAITAVDKSLGTLQYTLVTTNPAEADWKSVEAAGPVSNASALLLPTTARLRFNTGLIPHHAAGAPFLPLESKLDTGLTFRAWDQTSGTVEGRADTSTNGGSTAFSTATETVKVYFEARLFRTFNTNAELNVYTLEAEFNALTQNPALQDRSTSAFTGFTILMSPVPELGTAPLLRMLYGVQFNADGTETDMGYRYLTTNEGEASFLEGLGRADKRPQRDGTYFREIGDPAIPSDPGVNNRTAILGYIYTTQQPGTQQMTQVYRLDDFPKPTRPGGTRAGSPTTTTVLQQQGDHVYTTNTPFETSRRGTWVIEANRGFVRELSPNPSGSQEILVVNKSAAVTVAPAKRSMPGFASSSVAVISETTRTSRWETLVAITSDASVPTFAGGLLQQDSSEPVVSRDTEKGDSVPSIAMFDDLFTDGALLSDLILFG